MLLGLQSNETTRVYASRDNTLMAMLLENNGNQKLVLSFESDMIKSGYAVLDNGEIGHFTRNLNTFFDGSKFNYNAGDVRTDDLPQVHMTTTNWGEPYDQGLCVVFNRDFENYEQHIGFALVERDIKDLNNWLQGRLQKQKEG